MWVDSKLILLSDKQLYFIEQSYLYDDDWFIVKENLKYTLHQCISSADGIIKTNTVYKEKYGQTIYKTFPKDQCFKVKISSNPRIIHTPGPVYSKGVFGLEDTDLATIVSEYAGKEISIEYNEYCIHNSKNSYTNPTQDITSCGEIDSWYSSGICRFCNRPIIQNTFTGFRHSVYLTPKYVDNRLQVKVKEITEYKLDQKQ